MWTIIVKILLNLLVELCLGLVNQELTSQIYSFTLPSAVALDNKLFASEGLSGRFASRIPGGGLLSSALGVSSLYRPLPRPCSATPGEESWQSDFTVPHMSTMLMLVRRQRLGSQPWLPLRVTFCMCGWVYLCVCGFFFSSPSFMFAFDAEWQGNPEPPTFSCCLYFSSPLLLLSFFAHLASVNSPLTFWDCDRAAQIPYTSWLVQC